MAVSRRESSGARLEASGVALEPRDEMLPARMVITRVRVRRPHHVLSAWLTYRRILRASIRVDGFLASSFLIEGPFSFVTMSLWRDQLAIELFETAAASLHPGAVRWTFRNSSCRWSVVASSLAISPSSRTWTKCR